MMGPEYISSLAFVKLAWPLMKNVVVVGGVVIDNEIITTNAIISYDLTRFKQSDQRSHLLRICLFLFFYSCFP
jgi:hypothetical protein